jgi:hypothetical protein
MRSVDELRATYDVTVIVALVLLGVVLTVIAVLTHRAWSARHSRDRRGPISEAQARENAAPLSTAIVASDRRERAGS